MTKLDKDKLFNEFNPQNKAEWLAETLQTAKIESIEALQTQTYEGIILQPFYAKEEQIQNDLSPDDFPERWLNRETIKDLNEVPALLEKGTHSFGIHLDKNTNIKHLPKALEKTPVHFVLSAGFEDMGSLASYEGAASIDADYLSRWAMADQTLDKNAANLTYLIQKSTHKALCINAQTFGNAGANAVQELGFAVSLFVEYLDQLTAQNISAEKLFAQSHFTFSIGANYFMEIAKFRVMRLLWKRLGLAYRVPHSVCEIHAQTSLRNKSEKDAYNNMLRATTEAMSAIVGGVTSITVQPYDASFRESDDFSRRIARNISTVLELESHFDKVKDMAAGAYYIEYLSQSLLDKSWEMFLDIERKGGFVKAKDFILAQIQATAQQRRADFDAQKSILVGVNKFQNPKETP